MKRPFNYSSLSEREKWEIDDALGILDWDGSCPHKKEDMCEECLQLYMRTHDG